MSFPAEGPFPLAFPTICLMKIVQRQRTDRGCGGGYLILMQVRNVQVVEENNVVWLCFFLFLLCAEASFNH